MATEAPDKPKETKDPTDKARALVKMPISGAMEVYRKVSDPVAFVQGFGNSIFKSGMFNCSNKEQGEILAMTCLTKRMSPTELVEKYHFIGGKLTLKTDNMLAEFHKMGGKSKLLSRTDDRAAIALQKPGEKEKDRVVFEFTWAEAQTEDYVYSTRANKGEVPKRLPDGSINPVALKDNWSTPRRRRQMLWARVLSDGIRALCPEVNAGNYSPDELGFDYIEDEQVAAPEQDDNDEAIDADFEVQADPKPEPVVTETKPTTTTQSESAPGVNSGTGEGQKTAPSDPPFNADTTTATTEPKQVDPVMKLLIELKGAKGALGITEEQWAGVLLKNGVKSAKELPLDRLQDLRDKLWSKVEAAGKERLAELKAWAETQVGSLSGK